MIHKHRKMAILRNLNLAKMQTSTIQDTPLNNTNQADHQ